MKRPQLIQKISRAFLGTIGLVFLAIGAAIWAANLMDSAQNYRSPLANTPPSPGQTLGKPVTRQIVIVLIDALRNDTSTQFRSNAILE